MRGIRFILVLFALGLSAQELPPIQNFSPMDYNGENQNWSMAQDARGHMFVANNHNLLEYDGVRWRSHAAPNASIFRSVQVNDSLVFTGQYMEFGFWKRDAYGNMGYTSISQGLNMPMVEDEEFWNIITMEDWVLFQSLDRIYSYHLGSGQFKVQDVRSNKAHIFKAAGTVYFQDEVLGLQKIDQGEAVPVLDKAALQHRTIVGLYPQDGALLLIMDNGQFFRLEKERELYEIKGTDVALEALNIYCTVRLADGSLVLGTISQGMFQVTPQGRVVRTIDQRNGLNNNTVLSLFQDRSQNLWLGLDNGISVLNMESPFNEYVDNLGRLGLVYASKIVDGKLYLGTNQGLFVKQRGDASDFQLVRGTEGQVWTLAFLEGTLFCGHNKGTFTVEGEKAQLISPFPGTWTVKEIPGRPDELLQGNYDGLSLLKKEQGQWTFSHVLQGFGISSRFVEVLNKDRILVNHEYKGLFELEVDADFRKVKRMWEHSIMGYGSSIVHFQDRLRYASLDAAFVKEMDTLAFEPDTVLINLLYEKAGGITGILKVDPQEQRLWSLTKEGLSHISANSFNGALEVQNIPIPEFFRRSMGVAGFENVERIGVQRYLIGTSNGFVTLDLAKQQQRAHTINISAVRVQQGFGEEPIVLPLGGAEALKNKQNTVSFTYGVAQFNKYSEVRYQYRLQGLFEEWSLWGTDATATFSNLKYGDYVFQVRAKVGNAPTVNTASYNFTVLRPWYWSGWAIAGYLGALLGLFFAVHRLYKAYYTKKQNRLLEAEKKKQKRKKLKAERKLVQLKNEKLQTEIEAKNRELAVATMSMIKKNEFLGTIKGQLAKMTEDRNIKTVVKTIDRNINNEDDWKFFEEAFNNADKDFLKKIKQDHPELTHNDLKLCAYLRLNLSSKEIAPLLNISVKSVEVKRYRLRKKMDLEHETGLTDYIMGL